MANVILQDFGKRYLKVDIIRGAYSQLRISGLTTNPTPEDLEVALMRLENMIAEWGARNILINYNFEDEPDPNSLTNVNSAFANALETNLAVRLIPDFNKDVPQVLYSIATGAFSTMSSAVALQRLNQVQYPQRQPTGSGNSKLWNRWRRFYRDCNGRPNVSKSYEIYEGDINDYVEHFDSYLHEGETILNLDIQVDDGLILVSSSFDDDNAYYRIEADDKVNCKTQVTIFVRTSEFRVETRKIYFDIKENETPDFPPIVVAPAAVAGEALMQAGEPLALAGEYILVSEV